MRFSTLSWLLIAVFTQSIVSLGAVIGIDYGYQFGKAMVVSLQAPLEIVLTPESQRKDENGVAIRIIDGIVERTYGSVVSSSIVTRFPSNSLMHLKPLFGKLADENLNAYYRAHPGVILKASDRGSVAFSINDQEFPVEEVAAMNLQQYINRANDMLKEKGGDDTVVQLALTVPEYFTIEQRNSLMDAVSLIPLQRPYLVSEGLSVAVDFSLKQKFEAGKRYYYIIYDMGTGSTKASLVSIEQPEGDSEPLRIELLGYGHTDDISGVQVTLAISELISNKFLEHHRSVRSSELEASARSQAKIIQAAEKAKLILSANADAIVNIESLLNGIDFKATVYREEVEEYLEPFLTGIIKPINDALSGNFGGESIALSQLDGVILTGGSSRVPIVKKTLVEYLGEDLISKKVNADESAVHGVTIRGVQLSKAFKIKPLHVIDRSIFSYEAKFSNQEYIVEIFSTGSTYPNKTSFTTLPLNGPVSDFQIDLYENGRLFQTVDVYTEQLNMKFITECADGIVYNANFSLSANRIFECENVEAVCLGGSVTRAVQSASSSGDEGVTKGYEDQDINKNTDKKIEFPARPKKLSLKSEYRNLKPYSSKEKINARSKLAQLNRSDKEREQLQTQLNHLESLLYDTMYYLEDEEVIAKGPKSDIKKLSEIVTEYLEWLDYGYEDASLIDINEKIVEVSTIKSKIKLYLEFSDEIFDHYRFEKLIQNSRVSLNEFKNYQNILIEQVKVFDNDFEAIGLNATREYLKMKAPRSVSFSPTESDVVIKNLESLLNEIEEMLNTNSIENKPREDLFELNMLCENSVKELDRLQTIRANAHTYRLRELQSFYNRKLRALKRKDEKLKPTESVNSEISDETTDSHETTTTTTPEHSAELEHDEL
ncbi:Hsp70 family chaperone LHS1 Ecym_5437 [Eremothecium cymbalariae DBVPG|uniref:Uncharacterized protein n=1 Tax=Eremothecium cymbalariae (strain CBS 270.75 / DBVPG 7215 / KCTC 17166 / NRRL Y-17582) TaxID=931890 RepID=I6NDP7_ERECY|nr:hypothetical protein Ecym_5437 [Eremothecium cymbalariae DBVPG\